MLYFFPEYDTPMFQWQRIHIISELERHGVLIETFNPLVYESPEQANNTFIGLLREGKYDLFMSGVCYEGIIFKDVIDTAHELGIPSLLIRWDNLTVPFYDKNQAKLFDLVWLTSSDTKYLYEKWGARYLVQPYAANPYAFSYSGTNLVRKVCFLGTPYGSRSIMINHLTNKGVNVDLYYGGNQKTTDHSIQVKYDIVSPPYWQVVLNRLSYKEGRKIIQGAIMNKIFGTQTIKDAPSLSRYPSIRVQDVSSVYSKYSLCLASTSTNHTDRLSSPLKIVNLRSFEIPMSGGIALCKYNPELASYFEDGKEILFYHSDEELIELARYFTTRAKEEEILCIKTAARKRAENEHTWWNRFSNAFKQLNLDYE